MHILFGYDKLHRPNFNCPSDQLFPQLSPYPQAIKKIEETFFSTVRSKYERSLQSSLFPFYHFYSNSFSQKEKPEKIG
jgi:hypothetical protein